LAPAAIRAGGESVVEDVRAVLQAHGLAMARGEIRRQCWAPMVARLVGAMETCGDDDAGPPERALCFLAVLGAATPRAGDEVSVEVEACGEVSLRWRPRRRFRRNRLRLGNWRTSMAALPPDLTDVT
jgi:hypothetical protein